MKVSLLNKNPENVNIIGWQSMIQDHSNYPISLIENHMKRFN